MATFHKHIKNQIKLPVVAFILFFGVTVSAQVTMPKQVKRLKAFHRSNQTFLVWNGIESYGEPSARGEISGGLLQTEFKKKLNALKQAKKDGHEICYRVYRSDRPIDANSLQDVELLAEVQPLSVYYPFHLGMSWYEDKHKNEIIPRLAVEPEKPLEDYQELYVHTVNKSDKSYYAVLAVINGKENTFISDENSLIEPLKETPGEPEPVLQRIERIDKDQHYVWQKGPAEVRYYVRWVHEPYANISRCYEWAVAVPDSYNEKKPAALQLSLHSWGGNADRGTYWYDVKPNTIRIAAVNYPPQDWWYGYRNNYEISELKDNDIVFNYTERRLMSFINWTQKKWNIDKNLIFVEGQSMGGAGAISFGMKNGDTFCYANSWVGIACWRHSTYFRKGERAKWGNIEQLMNYNGVKFDDWMDLSWWLHEYPKKETPFLSFANGKNDGGIGWDQAVRAVNALWETKRPFVFLWGMSGHGQRAKFMMNPDMMALDKSIPAFRSCSLDDGLGTGTKLAEPKKFETREGKILDDWYDGDSTGQINAYLLWKNVNEEKDKYEITVYLDEKAPKSTCIVDMTPRRTKVFKAKPGQKFRWTNSNVYNKNEIQAGEITADKWGLVTIEKLKVSKAGNRIRITVRAF